MRDRMVASGVAVAGRSGFVRQNKDPDLPGSDAQRRANGTPIKKAAKAPRKMAAASRQNNSKLTSALRNVM